MAFLNIILINLIVKLLFVFTSVDGDIETLEDFSKNNTAEVILNPEMTSQMSIANFQKLQ